MKVALVQFDNRPLDRLGLMPFLIRRNADYARARGYEHFFIDKAYFDLPVYWQKPSIVRRVLESGYDVAAWLDTDAVVHDFEQRIEDLFEGPEVMVAAPDIPGWDAPFNAGVFFVKAAGGQGAQLMQRWAELFATTRWERTETAWVCMERWAGPDYEQGAFIDRLLGPLTASGELRMADWSLLQRPTPAPGAFTLHFAHKFKANIADYLALI